MNNAQEFREELKQRGLVYQMSTESLEELFPEGQKRRAYFGADPTANSLHVGNLLGYVLAEHLIRAGHEVILLIGGGTGLIGDPSGKDKEREFSDQNVVERQAARLLVQLSEISGLSSMESVNNVDWLGKLSMIEFLRDVGKHFTVNTMLKKESVARRIESEQGISFTEFSYAILQGYDFYHLYTHKNVDMQFGGSDQWGNIVSGVEYIRRKTGETVYGLTMPLVVDKATGKKFGKSEGNAIWLDPTKTSHYYFYQFWLNTTDESVIDYLKLFTFVPLEEITDLENQTKEEPHLRAAQKRLAQEVTTFVHGKEHTENVQKVSELLFTKQTLDDLSEEEYTLVQTYAPILEVEKTTAIPDLLIFTGVASSKREAREFLKGGAIKIDGEQITDNGTLSEILKNKELFMLTRGKKNKVVVRVKY
jgi:tyrosyl-tRNA synthetase